MLNQESRLFLAGLFLIGGCAQESFLSTDGEEDGATDEVGAADVQADGTEAAAEVAAEERMLSSEAKGEVEGYVRPFRHPFLGVRKTKGGALPLLEQKNAATGERFAVGDFQLVHEEGGVPERGSGLLLLQRSRAEGVPEFPVEPAPFVADTPLDKLSWGAREKLREHRGGVLPDPNDASVLVDPGSPFLLFVAAEWDQGVTLDHELDIAIARGEVTSQKEHDDTARALRIERQERFQPKQEKLREAVERQGGKVLWTCANAPCLLTSIPAAMVETLLAQEVISKADAPRAPVEDSNMRAVERAHQIDQFVYASYVENGNTYAFDGENGAGSDIVVAVQELAFPRVTHRAFRNSSSSSTDRFTLLYNCNNSGQCAYTSSTFGNENWHASRVAGILLGDLTDGQQSGLSTAQEEQRSGASRESWAYAYDVDERSSSNMLAIWDHMADRPSKPELVQNSIGTNGDPNCTGQSLMAQYVNQALYENSILMFEAAGTDSTSNGDEQPGSNSNCTIREPGAALGVFTVAGLGENNTSNTCDTRNRNIWSNSPYGGVNGSNASAEGQGRSIVDIAAPAFHSWKPDDDSDTAYGNTGGTSFASPTAAGAAIDFMDMYRHEFSTFINDPGALFTSMLLMGDRQSGGSRMTSRFSHRYGSGRLQMRDTANGLDAPHEYFNGWTCVDHGEVYDFQLDGGAVLPNDMDAMKAVAWWFTPSHDNQGVNVDNVDLQLRRNGSLARRSDDPLDNKERAYLSDVGGDRITLRLIGTNVHSDNSGCGTNSIKVYFSFFAEDSDRESPTYNPSNCIGVKPE